MLERQWSTGTLANAMTAKQKLRQAVEELSELEAEKTLAFIARRQEGDPVAEVFENAPVDHEPTTPEEDRSAAEACEQRHDSIPPKELFARIRTVIPAPFRPQNVRSRDAHPVSATRGVQVRSGRSNVAATITGKGASMSPSRNPLSKLGEKWTGRGGGSEARKVAKVRRAEAKAELREFHRNQTPGSPGGGPGSAGGAGGV